MKPSGTRKQIVETTQDRNTASSDVIHLDAQRIANVEALTRLAYERGMADGVNSVRFIRCADHRHVPQQEAIAMIGQECGICVMQRGIDRIREDVEVLIEHAQTSRCGDDALEERVTLAAGRLGGVFRVRSGKASIVEISDRNGRKRRV